MSYVTEHNRIQSGGSHELCHGINPWTEFHMIKTRIDVCPNCPSLTPKGMHQHVFNRYPLDSPTITLCSCC